jgi:hypothetical protein
MESKKSHATLLASVLEHRVQLNKIHDGMAMTKASVDAHAKKQHENATLLRCRLDDANTTLLHVRSSTDSTSRAVVNIRSLVTQLIQR